jgi:hypothetical protein
MRDKINRICFLVVFLMAFSSIHVMAQNRSNTGYGRNAFIENARCKYADELALRESAENPGCYFSLYDRVINAILNNIPLLCSVLLTSIGWFVSYKIGFSGFKYQFKKEEYYKLKESFLNINNLFFQFFELVHNFINDAINKYSTSAVFTEYELNKFSSDKMLKLTFIFNLISMEFPEISINKKEYLDDTNGIEMFYTKLRNISDKKNAEEFISSVTEVSNIISQLSAQFNELLIQMNNIIKNKINNF